MCFYFHRLFHYQQVRYPCSSPFGWEGRRWFSLVLEYPAASLLLVCSPSFFTLHFSTACLCSLFAFRISLSRVVLLFLLGASARIADWNSQFHSAASAGLDAFYRNQEHRCNLRSTAHLVICTVIHCNCLILGLLTFWSFLKILQLLCNVSLGLYHSGYYWKYHKKFPSGKNIYPE